MRVAIARCLQGAAKDKKAAAKAAALAKASAGKAADKKPAPVERTQCVYEVKPAEAGQDMADLEARVRAIKKEGLSWGEQFKVVDVAYGIQKLIIQFLVDERCGLQDVEDAVRLACTVCVCGSPVLTCSLSCVSGACRSLILARIWCHQWICAR